MARASDPSGKSSTREDDPHARRAEVSISTAARVSSRSKTDASRAFHRRNAPAYACHASAKRRIKTRFEESCVSENARASVSKARVVSLALSLSACACSPRASDAPAAPSTTSGNDTTTYAQSTSRAGNAYFCARVSVTESSSSLTAERIAAKAAFSRAVSPARRARLRAARSDASSFPATRAKNERAARRTPSSRTASANASNSNVSSFVDDDDARPSTGAGRVARKRAARRLVATFSAAKRRQTLCARTAARVSRPVVFVFVRDDDDDDDDGFTRVSDDVFDV